MLQLLKTNDGMLGLRYPDKKVVWAESLNHLVTLAYIHYKKQDHTMESIHTEIGTALDVMAQTGDDMAEFGVFGSFMYTTKEQDADDVDTAYF